MNTEKLRKIVLKLWRGQYGLARTWWLFGILGTALLNLVSGPLNATVAAMPMDGIGAITLGLVAGLLAAFGVCYGVVVSVGVVRAAVNHAGNRLWSWLAIALTAAVWLGAVAYVVVQPTAGAG